MKTISRIIYTVIAIAWLMLLVTYTDIISHNHGPNHGKYWLPTTKATVNRLVEYGSK